MLETCKMGNEMKRTAPEFDQKVNTAGGKIYNKSHILRGFQADNISSTRNGVVFQRLSMI